MCVAGTRTIKDLVIIRTNTGVGSRLVGHQLGNTIVTTLMVLGRKKITGEMENNGEYKSKQTRRREKNQMLMVKTNYGS